MKLLTIAFLLAAGTANAGEMLGCTTVINSAGQLNKADPTCVFAGLLPGSRIVKEGVEAWFPDNGDSVVDTITVRDN